MKNGIKTGMKQRCALLLAVMLLAGLTGCGKGGKETNSDKKDFVYTAEFLDLGTELGYIDDCVASGNTLYMEKSEWDEETEKTSNFIYKYNLDDSTSEDIALSLGENANVVKMKMNAQGNLVMFVNLSAYETNESGETINSENKIELTEVSPEDGSVIHTVDITSYFETGNGYTQYMELDSQDNVYIYQDSMEGAANILLLDKTGKLLGKIPCDNWINAMFASKEGTVYVFTYGTNGMEVKPIDTASKSFGVAITTLGDIRGNSFFTPGNDKGIVGSDGSKVFKYDFTANQKEDLFTWLDIDVNSDGISVLGELEDGRYWALITNHSMESGDVNTELILVQKESADSVVQKEEITYGAMWIDSTVKNQIINFNKTNEKYRINYKEYANDDYMESLTQLNNELVSGTAPDIIDVTNLNFAQYANKGLLEDIYSYMERDGIKKEDYLTNAFKAFEVNDKLYVIAPRFYIDTALVKKAKLGDVTGWNLTEFLAYAEAGEEGSELFQYASRTSIFNYCIYNSMDEFVDWKEGTCSFESDEFIKVLEFAAQYPEEVDYNKEVDSVSESLRSDQLRMLQSTISSVQELQMLKGLMGEDVVFVGYPNSERKGNLIRVSGGSMAINAKSKCKEGAWEFIKTMLGDTVQDEVALSQSSWGFPIKVSSLEKRFAKDMEEETYKDEGGTDVVEAKTTWGYDDFNIEIFAATQEEIDEVHALINSAETTVGSTDTKIQTIIQEEANAFFAGQKTAKEVAEIIQSRVQTYVNEQR